MKKGFLFIISLGFILFNSCAISTWSDYDREVEKGNYDTFKMFLYDTDVEFGTNPINRIRIENAVKSDLINLGLERSDNPDLLVKFFVKLDHKEFIETCNNVYDDYEGGEYCIERVIYYEQGTLVIDIIDAKKDKIIWHGVAEGAPLDRMNNPDKKIKSLVRKLMLDFDAYRLKFLV